MYITSFAWDVEGHEKGKEGGVYPKVVFCTD